LLKLQAATLRTSNIVSNSQRSASRCNNASLQWLLKRNKPKPNKPQRSRHAKCKLPPLPGIAFKRLALLTSVKATQNPWLGNTSSWSRVQQRPTLALLKLFAPRISNRFAQLKLHKVASRKRHNEIASKLHNN
jgi:hypothetical protein